MLSDSQLTGILNSTARAHAAAPGKHASAIPFLCQTIIQQLNYQAVQLWQVDDSEVVSLWQVVSSGQPLSLDRASLQAVELGTAQSFSAPTPPGEESSAVCTLTGVMLGETAKLVILFQGDHTQFSEDDCLQLAEIIGDMRRRELLDQLLQRHQRHQRVVNFINELHEVTSREDLLQVFVTDGVAASDFERIFVLSRESFGKWKVVAATGVVDIAERSEEVQRLSRLASEAEKTGEATGDVVPLSMSGEWSHADEAVVFERQSEWTDLDKRSANLLANQMKLALQQLPERRRLGKSKSRHVVRQRRVLAALLLFIVFGCLILSWRTEFKIRSYGQAVPRNRQEIFAPERGVIQNVHVQHGAFVESGAPLFDIYNDELQVLRETTNEELVTAKARQAALQTVSPRGPGSSFSDRGLPTSVELAELAKKIESLEKQLELVDQQLASLLVVAPFDGYVYRERMEQELPGRPVQQGQYVVQIAAIDGPWELRLRIPENEVRHLLHAKQVADESLSVTFALETTPDIEHRTELDHLSSTTDLDDFGSLSSLAICELSHEEIPDARFGAGVLAKVHCGRRTLGYLATRRVVEFWVKYSPF